MQRANNARGLRFLPKVAYITTVAAVSAAICYQASAQTVTTDPVGFITLTAVGTATVGAPAFSLWSLGMTPVPVLRGAVTAVASNAVAISGLTAGQFNQVAEGAQFYIEDLGSNSTYVGFSDDIGTNDANNLYLANNDAAFIQVGDSVKIYPHWTFGTAFGANNAAGFVPGSLTTADQLQIQNAVTHTFTTYFYATASKTVTAGWKNAAGGDATSVPLYQDQGILVSKKSSTNLTVVSIGAVKLGRTLIPLVGPGQCLPANVYATSVMTLGTSGLYNGGNSTNSLVAGSLTSADQVQIHNDSAGGFATYYYATSSKTVTAGWKTAAGADATNVSIPMGAEVLVVLQAGHNGFTWAPAAPY